MMITFKKPDEVIFNRIGLTTIMKIDWSED